MTINASFSRPGEPRAWENLGAIPATYGFAHAKRGPGRSYGRQVLSETLFVSNRCFGHYCRPHWCQSHWGSQEVPYRTAPHRTVPHRTVPFGFRLPYHIDAGFRCCGFRSRFETLASAATTELSLLPSTAAATSSDDEPNRTSYKHDPTIMPR